MAEISKVPVKTDKTRTTTPQPWKPFEALRREVDRLFEDFDGGFWRPSFRYPEAAFKSAPVDVGETDKAYEVTAELPGMDEKNIEVKLANGCLTIKAEKQEDKEEKNRDYYVRERSFGSFLRTFQIPDGVDQDKIDASYKNGVLTVALPKSVEAQKAEKKITIKAA